jgi:hypothetical protein
MDELRKNFTATSKPDFAAIAGAFSCLDRCFTDYVTHQSDRFSDDSDPDGDGRQREKALKHPVAGLVQNATLWEYLLKAASVATSPDATRYALSSKALRFIKHHAELFTSVIGTCIVHP